MGFVYEGLQKTDSLSFHSTCFAFRSNNEFNFIKSINQLLLMMDQLFTVHNMRNQEILDTTCEHLSLEDLLKLEEVSHMSALAVATHQYQQLVQLGRDTPELTSSLIGRDSGEALRGPLITNAAIVLSLNKQVFKDMVLPAGGSSKVPKLWHWMVSTVVLRAAHLKQLKLTLDTYEDESMCNAYRIKQTDFQAMNFHADSLLTGISFTQCTQLRVDCWLRVSKGVKLLLVLDFLKHFPNLEDLYLEGDRLPRLSSLPAPHKLKKLKLAISGHKDQLLTDQLMVCNFTGLESLSFVQLTYIDGEDMIKAETFNTICRLTGVDWMKSTHRLT